MLKGGNLFPHKTHCVYFGFVLRDVIEFLKFGCGLLMEGQGVQVH